MFITIRIISNLGRSQCLVFNKLAFSKLAFWIEWPVLVQCIIEFLKLNTTRCGPLVPTRIFDYVIKVRYYEILLVFLFLNSWNRLWWLLPENYVNSGENLVLNGFFLFIKHQSLVGQKVSKVLSSVRIDSTNYAISGPPLRCVVG